jgi:phosphate transport system permease protein
MNGTSVQRAESSSRASVLRRLRTSDLVFHGLTRAAAITVLVLLSGVILALIVGRRRARTFGSSPPRWNW